MKINVHRIQKQYIEEKKTTVAPTRRINRSLSVTSDTPMNTLSLTSLEAVKKPPKYVLYINCKDFLEMQSWMTHFKDMVDDASPLPVPLYPLNAKSRLNGIRRTTTNSRKLHPGGKMQTISLEEAADRMQVSTPKGTQPPQNEQIPIVPRDVSPVVVSTTPRRNPQRNASHSGAITPTNPNHRQPPVTVTVPTDAVTSPSSSGLSASSPPHSPSTRLVVSPPMQASSPPCVPSPVIPPPSTTPTGTLQQPGGQGGPHP